MSISYKLFELLVRLGNIKKICNVEASNFEVYCSDNLSNQSHMPPPKMYKNYNIEELEFKSNICYKVSSKNSNSKDAIMLVHGGAYILEMGRFSWKVVSKLIDRLDITVYIPIYPLCPKYSYIDTYELLIPVYEKILRSHSQEKITIMGDSAGAQISLSFCQHLNKLELPQPKDIILLSPSIEAKPSTETINKMKDIEHLDCILSSNIFNYISEYWAKGTSYDNYLVSPIYGDFNNLGRLHIFMGTSEIFYIHINRLLNKIYESNSIVKYYEGKNMMHTWPVLPCGKEGNESFEVILDIIKN